MGRGRLLRARLPERAGPRARGRRPAGASTRPSATTSRGVSRAIPDDAATRSRPRSTSLRSSTASRRAFAPGPHRRLRRPLLALGRNDRRRRGHPDARERHRPRRREPRAGRALHRRRAGHRSARAPRTRICSTSRRPCSRSSGSSEPAGHARREPAPDARRPLSRTPWLGVSGSGPRGRRRRAIHLAERGVEEAVARDGEVAEPDARNVPRDADGLDDDASEQDADRDRRPRSGRRGSEDAPSQLCGTICECDREEERVDRPRRQPDDRERGEGDRERGHGGEDQVRRRGRPRSSRRTSSRLGSRCPIALKASEPASAKPPKTPYMSAEVGRASERLPREHRHDDGERRVQEVRHEDGQHDRADEPVIPDEANALRELGEDSRSALVHAPVSCADATGIPATSAGGDHEARRVDPEGRRRAERRDEHSSERRADEQRAALDRASYTRRALHPHRRRARRRRGTAPGARSCPGASSSAPRNTSAISCQSSIPTVEWSSGIAATAAALARSATTLVVRKPSRSTTTPPKKAARTTGRKLKKTARPGERRAPRGDEHEPRDRELRDHVPDERDRVRHVERVQRAACRHRRHSGIVVRSAAVGPAAAVQHHRVVRQHASADPPPALPCGRDTACSRASHQDADAALERGPGG